MRLLTFATVLPLAFQVLAVSLPNVECNSPATFSTFIGENKDVLMEVSSCDSVPSEQTRDIHARDNVCGAPCKRHCQLCDPCGLILDLRIRQYVLFHASRRRTRSK